MLSVIIRTNNGEQLLPEVLRPLVTAAAEGIVRDVVFLDFGSHDGTAAIADTAGAEFVKADAEPLKGAMAKAHRGSWILLLDQNTVLAPGWMEESLSFVERQERLRSARGRLSGCFRPEHEPELGSSDVRRRMITLALNRLRARARLSQGVLVRRADLSGKLGLALRWEADDPSLRLPGLLRLRSRSYLARPLSYDETPTAEQAGTESIPEKA